LIAFRSDQFLLARIHGTHRGGIPAYFDPPEMVQQRLATEAISDDSDWIFDGIHGLSALSMALLSGDRA
jgi:hypothetical protein